MDHRRAVRMQPDQHHAAVFVGLFQVFLVNLPIGDGGGFAAGAEPRHFDRLRRNVAGVVAVEYPGRIGDAVAHDAELFRRRGQLVLDLGFDAAFGRLFDHRAPFGPYLGIHEMGRRRPRTDPQYGFRLCRRGSHRRGKGSSPERAEQEHTLVHFHSPRLNFIHWEEDYRPGVELARGFDPRRPAYFRMSSIPAKSSSTSDSVTDGCSGAAARGCTAGAMAAEVPAWRLMASERRAESIGFET